MIKVTQDLKHTLQTKPHIKKVYFDKLGDFHFNVHEHEGKKYTRIKDFMATVTKTDENGKPLPPKRERIIEAHPDHEIVDVLDSIDVLNTEIEEEPTFKDLASKEIFDEQAKENAKLRAELEDLKAKKGGKKSDAMDAELEELRAKLAESESEKAKLAEENQTYQQLLDEKAKDESGKAEDLTKQPE